MLVAWSPIRSMFLAMNSRWVQAADVARVLHHVGEELAEQARIHLVELLVAPPDGERLVGVALDIGVEDVLDHAASARRAMRGSA